MGTANDDSTGKETRLPGRPELVKALRGTAGPSSLATPSLGTRLVAAGVAVVAVLAVSLDLLLYFSLHSSLQSGIDRSLEMQASLVRFEAERDGTAALPTKLTELGVTATVTSPEGIRTRSGPVIAESGPVATRRVRFPDGTTVDVTTPRGDADSSLARLLRLELILTPLLIALAYFMLRLISEIALRPLEQIAAAARRTAGGSRGERLRPGDPSTRLGQMATAYDDMLDALENAVAEARAAQARSDRLQERDREILQTAHEAFIGMDEEGRIVEWNAEAERTFGWTRDEALGREVAETIIPPELRPLHRSGLEHYLMTGLARMLGREIKLTAVRRDGTRFPVVLTVWATQHEGRTIFNSFIRDVTEREKAEETASRLAAIVESSDAAMLSTTLDGVIETWNLGAERMYGWTAEEAVGQHLFLIVPEAEREKVMDSLQAMREGSPVQRVEAVRRTKNGTRIDVALTISPVRDSSGKVCGASSIARDITEEHWMAAQLDSTLHALEAALDEARGSEAATRRFLDDAAHQLRTPITSIRASAEALARGTLPEERDRLVSAVVRETSRASRLMTGLLQMARLHHGRRLNRQACDLVTLCREEADRVQWVSPQLEVDVVESASAPPEVEIDPQAVAEILANLLDNARRHAHSRIEMSVESQNGHVNLKVSDDGPGLPAGKEESVFDRFVSLDARGGSGLGLPIARELARAHGGDLTYDGKAFVVTLPAGSGTAPTTA